MAIIRRLTFIGTHRCCDDRTGGAPTGKEWRTRVMQEFYFSKKPKATLWKWYEENGSRIAGAIAEGDCQAKYEDIHMCPDSLIMEDITVEQFKNGKRTKLHNPSDVGVEISIEDIRRIVKR